MWHASFYYSNSRSEFREVIYVPILRTHGIRKPKAHLNSDTKLFESMFYLFTGAVTGCGTISQITVNVNNDSGVVLLRSI